MKYTSIIVFVTCSSMGEARTIAGSLLKKRFIACASIIGKVESKFWWRGKIDKASETLAIFKTSLSKFKAVEKEVKRLHSYEVPEIIATPIIAGSRDYLSWIDSSTRKQKKVV